MAASRTIGGQRSEEGFGEDFLPGSLGLFGAAVSSAQDFTTTDTVSVTESQAVGSVIGSMPIGTIPIASLLPPLPASAVSASSTPAWISNLTDRVIKADMTAAAATGQFTYSAALTVVRDLYNENLSTGKLSSGQFSDLKAIVANIGTAALAATAYVKDITNALVNGDALNAAWTGGNARSVSLGNLGIGSSETQLNELISKWFLGGDHPSSIVQGDINATVSYVSTSAPFWGSVGPSINDINQGAMGDCYLLSSLAEVTNNDPALIRSMIADNGNGTYGVRFYVGGRQEWVTVDSTVAYAAGGVMGNDRYHGLTNSWVDLVEKAYAQLNGMGTNVGTPYYGYGNSFTSIANGGWDSMILGEITGTSVSSYRASTSLLNTIVSALRVHSDVTLDSYTNTYDSQGRQNLVSSHAMSITGYDAGTGNLLVRNPWGAVSWQYWNTTFEVSLATLQSAGDVINIDSAGALYGRAPTLTSQTANQTWLAGTASSFTLAANTFTDPYGATLAYSARQTNGTALPSWLAFNATTGTFSGTPPAGASNVSVAVTATDVAGQSTSETFTFTVARPPTVANPTATQYWAAGHTLNFALAGNTFVDPQGAKLTYSATLSNGQALPSWLKFNAASESFTGTPPAGAASQNVTVTATDTYGASANETFSLQQATAPILAHQTANQTLTQGSAVNFSLAANTFADPQGAKLSYSASLSGGQALPSWLKFDSTTGTFTGTTPVGSANAGTQSLTVTATDTFGLSTSETFKVTAAPLDLKFSNNVGLSPAPTNGPGQNQQNQGILVTH